MIIINRKGYGQVEPNHLSGIITGEIYAQLPANENITQLEQGQFAKYDYATGEVNFSGDGQFMLVYNEEKLYDNKKQSHKDFVYKIKDFTDKKMYPRLIKTNIGDIFTTNTFAQGNSQGAAVVGTAIVDTAVVGSNAGASTAPTLSVGDYLKIGADGFLTLTSDLNDADMIWQVIKEFSMPDGQPAVKIERVK